MKMKHMLLTMSAGLGLAGLNADDWSQWGGTTSRNMISRDTIPAEFEPGEFVKGTEEVDMATTKNCRWVAKLGSQTYGTPTIANGKVYVGTNNETPRDPKHDGDRGLVMCFDEKTGKFLWQLVVPKLGAGKVSDWEYLGICSSPTIVGSRGFVVTNRCQILCFDTEGLANGNDGPFKDEAKFMAGTGKPPVEPGPTDADIIWIFDMREDLGVFPHNIASSSVLALGDKIIATTSNGVDWSHKNIPAPQAPSLIMLDSKTGELLGEETSGVSQRVLHCSWSSPAATKVDGKDVVIFGAGDGWCYGLSPITKKDDEGFDILPEIFRYDCNPPEYRKDSDGNDIKYPKFDGPSEVVATPVVQDGRAYVLVGQDPEHGEGVGMLSCIDVTGKGDLSGKAIWTYKGIERSMSTPSIANGMVYVADYTGRAYCIDAKTGEKYWDYDTLGHIWGSTLVVGNRMLLGNEEGELVILATGKEKKELGKVEFSAPIYSSPVVANDTLYVATQTHLYAFSDSEKKTAAK